MDLVKNTKDYRPESYRPKNLDKEIRTLEEVSTKADWALRKEIALQHVHTNLSELISETKSTEKGTSLAVMKPKKVLDFIWEKCERKWDKTKLDKIYANHSQGSLFDLDATKHFFKVVKKLPFKFSYIFTTEDNIVRTLMIEDWEMGMLYWNCLEGAKGDEQIACSKVKEKYFDYLYKQRDLYFFLGTTKQFHNVAPNPYIIIGTFYPPKVDQIQMTLF